MHGPTRGWQRSVVTFLSLTGSVLNHNHTITTRRPGARWACHYPGHSTNITPVSSLYINAWGASSGAWAVKVYFWMYSLHSERVAVGARQLWRQRVIVARQPDRPKMAELTGTGEQAGFTLALASLWRVYYSQRPHQHAFMMIIHPTETTIHGNSLLMYDIENLEKKRKRAERDREIRRGESEALLFRRN